MKVKSPIPGIVHRILLATHPGAPDDEIRASYGQAVANDVTDLRDLVRIGTAVLPASVFDYLDAERGNEAASTRVTAREQLEELRVALSDVVDVPGLNPRLSASNDATSGLGFALPVVRQFATEAPAGVAGSRPLLPGVAGGSTAGVVDPAIPMADGTGITFGDVGGAETWHYGAAIVLELAKQVVDWTDDFGRQVIDATLRDIADRAAETSIVQKLEGAAGGTRTAGTDLTAALVAAESAAGAGVGVCPMVLVSPTDLPKVRSALADHWSVGPVPELVPTVGSTPGKATVLGPAAVHLMVRPQTVDIQTKPSHWSSELAVLRPFYAAIRAAAQIQTVTGI